VISAIFLGIFVNRLGVMPALRDWPISDATLRTLELLGGLTTPLIALVIGYEVRLQRGSLLKPRPSPYACCCGCLPGYCSTRWSSGRCSELIPSFRPQ
jgi:hypothetical protein